MTDRSFRALQIFEQLLDADVDRRSALLHELCGDDEELSEHVTALLQTHEDAATRLPDSDAALTGMTVGDFSVEEQIGSGGMGVVFQARQRSLGRTVALKVLNAQMRGNRTARLRFQREVEVVATLNHAAIVGVYTTGEEGGSLYYAMELVEGPALSSVVQYFRLHPKRTQAEEIEFDDGESSAEAIPVWAVETYGSTGDSAKYFRVIASQLAHVADGLHTAHLAGIIHRDIKPSNLLLDRDGSLKLTDFGLARSLADSAMTQTGEVLGTPYYMAPEQIAASGQVDARTDVYALGATLYELLTLQPPFPGDSRDRVLTRIIHEDPVPPCRINSAVPRDLETVCLKAIDCVPDRRYQSAAALADDLRRFLNHEPLAAKRASLADRTGKWISRHRALSLMIAASMLLAIVGTAAGALIFAYQTSRHAEELQQAHHRTRQSLYEARLGQAQAQRFNRETGNRSRALAALAEAAEILPDIFTRQDVLLQEKRRVRNELASALRVPGFTSDADRGTARMDSRSIGFDIDAGLYVFSGRALELRRFADHEALNVVPQMPHRASRAIISPTHRYLTTLHRMNGSPRRFVQLWDLQANSQVLGLEVNALHIRTAAAANDEQPPTLAS